MTAGLGRRIGPAIMKITIQAALVCSALLGLVVVPAWADPPATGKVLLLENLHTLEGDIERQGDQYVVRKGDGEMRLSAVRDSRSTRNSSLVVKRLPAVTIVANAMTRIAIQAAITLRG